MLRTVVYIRKSSEEKDEKQIQSIERQESALRDFVENHNKIALSQSEKLDINWTKDVIRESQSAKKPGRKLFGAMIEKVHKEYYDVILCMEPSRLSRNPVDTGTLVHIMDLNKIRQIRTPTSIYRSESVTERFTLNLFLSIAKYENDQRGKNASSGMQNRKNQGATTNIAPMGYRNRGETKGLKYVEPDGDNFKLLKEMWGMFITGQYKIPTLYKLAVNRGLTLIKSQKG